MRATLERWLTETWYGERSPPAWLRAAVPLYRSRMERARREQSARRATDLEGRPIVVVGNITVGGTGKTPLVIGLVELARAAGLEPGVVSRGYGRDTRDGRWVTGADDPAQCGDEPVLIAAATGVPVRVDRDRAAGARALFEREVNIVISDDGLQHWRMPRAVEICVVDGERGLGNGELLPAGPLREPMERLAACDFVVASGCAAPGLGDAPIMHLEPGPLQPLTRDAGDRPPGPGQVVHAVTGIGHPERFFRTLEQGGWRVERHPFPDHHRFAAADFTGIGRPLVMTAKDAIKCRRLGLEQAWVLPVHARLPGSLERALEAAMLAAVEADSP